MHAKEEDGWRRRAKQTKTELPEKFKNRPVLKYGLKFFYESFWNLDSGRDFRETPARIAWRDIVFLCEYYGLSFEETEEFVYIIQAMDTEYIEHVRKKYDSSKPNKINNKKIRT